MAIPFTPEQFHQVFRDYNQAVWPAQWLFVGMALMAVAAAFVPRPRSGIVVSCILGILWAWMALVYHSMFFARINPGAYAFAAFFMIGSSVFFWQGVVRRKLTFQWALGAKSVIGVVLISFALFVYPIWSAQSGHPFPETPTFGLPCPTTIFSIGMLCFAKPPMPRSTLIVPLLWCLVGAQAAFEFGVEPDLALIAAFAVGVGLLLVAGKRQ